MAVASGRPRLERERLRYRGEVEALLEQIGRGVDQLERRMAIGVRGPGLKEQRRQLARARARLAALVAGDLEAGALDPGEPGRCAA